MLRSMQKLFTAMHSAVYSLSKGRVFGRLGKTRFLLLHTIGRKSAKERVTPLNYVSDGADFVVIASNGGARPPPGWYLNLPANPEAQAEGEGARRPARPPPRAAGPPGGLRDLAPG